MKKQLLEIGRYWFGSGIGGELNRVGYDMWYTLEQCSWRAPDQCQAFDLFVELISKALCTKR